MARGLRRRRMDAIAEGGNSDVVGADTPSGRVEV